MDLRSHILIQLATSERIVRDVLSVGAVTFGSARPAGHTVPASPSTCAAFRGDGRNIRVSRREHEDVLERARERLDRRPDARTVRRSTVEHPFATIKAPMARRISR